MAGAIYPAKIDLPDEIRDAAAVIAATARRLDGIRARLPDGMKARLDNDVFGAISTETAAALRALADAVEGAPAP